MDYLTIFLSVLALLAAGALGVSMAEQLVWRKLPRHYDPKEEQDATELELDLNQYRNFGLYHRTFPSFKKFAKLTVAEQAEYASVLPRRYGLNDAYLKQYYAKLTTGEHVQLSVTTMGDIAYLSQLHPASPWEKLYTRVSKVLQAEVASKKKK